MAKEVVYSIGQYRTQEINSDSENIYSPKCEIALDYFDTPISNDSSAYTTTKGYSFRDPYIKLMKNVYKTEAPGLQEDSATDTANGRVFSKNMVYYVRLAIPRNRIYDCDYNMVTKIEYPEAVISTLVNILSWDERNGSKMGIQSESIGRHSVSYFAQNDQNSLGGYPIHLFNPLKQFMMASRRY